MVIYVECEPDAALLRKLGFSRPSIRHRRVSGKGEIVKGAVKSQGIRVLMDEDPSSAQPGVLRGLPVQELSGYHLKVVQQGQSRLILLCPRLEDWLLWLAEQAGVDPEQYNLPRNARALHRIINKRLDNLDKFLESLMEHPKSREVLHRLRTLLQ